MPYHYEFNRHLWAGAVLDAHGIQRLTSRHPHHVHESVTEDAPNGFLVVAGDLARGSPLTPLKPRGCRLRPRRHSEIPQATTRAADVL